MVSYVTSNKVNGFKPNVSITTRGFTAKTEHFPEECIILQSFTTRIMQLNNHIGGLKSIPSDL